MHYGEPRACCAPPEAALGLLAGDQLYAIGLARLVAIGDTDAVSELADTITLSALAQAADEEELAEAVWRAGGRAVGWGSTPQHRRAKELVRDGSPEALAAMRTSAEGAVAASRARLDIVVRRCPTDVPDRNRSTRSTGASRVRSRARPSPAAGSWSWAPTRPA